MNSLKKYSFLLFVFLLFVGNVQSQNSSIDSLENLLLHHKENDEAKVDILNSISFDYVSSDIIKSEEKAQEAYSLAKKLNYKKGEAKSLLRLSSIYRRKSELDEAERVTMKALKIYKEINDQVGINSSYTTLGKIAYYRNDLDKAIEYYNIVLDFSIKNGNLKQQALILNDIGGTIYLKGDLDEARNLFKKSYAIREQLGEAKSGLGALNNIAVISLNQGRYAEALEYFNKCLSIYREDNNKSGIALSIYNMSAVYYELKQYDKSLSFLEEALQLNKELENRRMTASCLVNIGAVYADLKDFSKALEFMNESLRIGKEIDDKAELGAGYFQLGDLYFLMGQPKEALKNYTTSLELSIAIESKIHTCHSHIGLANSYVALKDYSKALYHVFEGKKIAEDLELLAQQKLALGILATIYSETGDYKKAFTSHQQFKTLNDSLFNKENIEKITQLEYEYKYKAELESANYRELKLTEKVNTTHSDLQKTQRNLLLGLIAFLLITLILAAIIFFLKLRNIKAQNQKIVLEQKLLRSQMTPHFIFNSLSVLQGMILNKEAKKAVSYLSKFSKLLRITLENSRDKTVPLEEELTAVENYLELQNLEENQSYLYTIVVDEEIDKSLFEIPPMLIQPFVENAIEHGFVNKKENKKIDVHLSFINKKLICTITDNGVGVDAKKENKNQQKKSLATIITSERLKALSKDFKIQGSINIENRQKYNQQGTIVTLKIPYKIMQHYENFNR